MIAKSILTSVPVRKLLFTMQNRFIGAWLGVLIYKAIAWLITPKAYTWSDEPLEALIIAFFVTAVLEIQDRWLINSDTTDSKVESSEAT
jgi:hypothetical protein